MKAKAKVKLPLEQIEAFAKRWRIQELALFGSVLRHDFGPDSDIDVLVSFEQDAHVDLFDLVRMEEELKGIFGRAVDVVTIESVESSRNYIRRREILQSAETVYVS
ncbi:MAG: nucleotidyltransferase domain-containing protein [Actinomycetia bacterium]|nr:nucleotidyltransferase domain-containing protein [Actinomycetes bacterium]